MRSMTAWMELGNAAHCDDVKANVAIPNDDDALRDALADRFSTDLDMPHITDDYVAAMEALVMGYRGGA